MPVFFCILQPIGKVVRVLPLCLCPQTRSSDMLGNVRGLRSYSEDKLYSVPAIRL